MKDFTPSLSSRAMKSSTLPRRSADSCRPRCSTILALRQFARSYNCAAALPVALGSFIAN
ncbi:MAG: hypothetical protein SO168_01825 [Muribaculaceae bacterium]|nr:hypothetical protein [Muribaculaceae bacterium]